MKYTEIPYVNKKVAKMVFGTATEAFRAGEDMTELLDAVYEMGATTIDTGRVYGESEKILGRWLDSRGLYDQVVLLSKCGHHDVLTQRKRVNEKDMWKDLETSCKYLKTDYIDIYVLHRDDPKVEVGTVVEIFNDMHAKGRIGAFGGSNWTHQRIQEANEYAEAHGMIPFTVSSPNYGLAHQVKDPWGGGCITLTGPENADARDWYRKTQMPVIAYSSLANGLFTGRFHGSEPETAKKFMCKEALKGYGYPENYERLSRCEKLAAEKGCSVSQIAMAWIYHQDLNSFAIVGTTSAKRMKENIEAMHIQLSPQECAYLNLETESLG